MKVEFLSYLLYLNYYYTLDSKNTIYVAINKINNKRVASILLNKNLTNCK